MSQFRDALPDDATRERFDAAMEGFAQVLAAGCDERDELYMRGGSMVVARAAFVPGGPSLEEIAALYEELRAEALAEQGRRSAPQTRVAGGAPSCARRPSSSAG